MTKNEKKKLLFICLGNICRSPAAHAVMQHMGDKAHLDNLFSIDSAGIGSWHVGQLPDRRMRELGARRGYLVNHRVRQFDCHTDFDRFDYIIVMDDDNYLDITQQATNDQQRSKVLKMKDYFVTYRGSNSVPDPYYGDAKDFERALDLIEDGCRGLLDHLL